jgi:hypothetical protein
MAQRARARDQRSEIRNQKRGNRKEDKKRREQKSEIRKEETGKRKQERG